MRYFWKNNEVFGYTNEQYDLGMSEGLVELTDLELDKHENPEKYLSDKEKAQLNRERMPTLKPIDFDIKLNDAGLYDAVQELIKDNFNLRTAYNRATYFSRTDPFIDQARIALGLTNEQVDELWTAP